ncbi:3'-5' exonuclease [Zafaria sp. Z1313]|uniref:3'-5' exonuclease n=1 Tax=Zafaria sp. Z1313 TaxID=3423202 RepID=UPI003D301BF0
MPFVSMVSAKNKVDGSIKKQVLDFLQKLQVDDTAPGLHIEPMQKPRDKRARTGRVNDAWRAVLFKMDTEAGTHYVYYGTWHHDEAIKIARSTVLKLNLALGSPEFEDQGLIDDEPSQKERQDGPVLPPEAEPEQHGPQGADEQEGGTDVVPDWTNQLHGSWTPEKLVAEAGINADGAARAFEARTPAELNLVIDGLPETQGLVILGLANGEDLDSIREELGIEPIEPDLPEDETLDRVLRRSTGGFVFVGDNPDELREALESMDIERWRVFLHPEQRKYVDGRWNGSFRLSGGAGTGKTVVLLHRARALFRSNDKARILLTTYTRTLAKSLSTQLTKLDPKVPRVELGETGVSIFGMDQIAARVLKEATSEETEAATSAVLGPGRNLLTHRANSVADDLAAAVDLSNPELPANLLESGFLEQEYQSVVLANGVVDEKGYLRAPRQGRGTALNRTARKELWKVFAQFRRSHHMTDTATFSELAAIAASVLTARADRGQALPFDHVLVDEAQDFHAAHWMLLRALAPHGPDDLFIAEDSHQRIYGQKVPLSRFGIQIRGRSRRLRLNYRTTAENLAYAISLLRGGSYTDIEDAPESTSEYRSVRSGPAPHVVHASSQQAEAEAATDHIRRWIDARIAPNAIAVLVRAEARARLAVEALSKAGIAYSVLKGGAPADRDKVAVMTMHAAKGMEFERVVVMGAGADEIPAKWSFERLPEAEQADALLRERSLLYVAATRARDELVITTSGEPSGLLSD